MDFPCVALVQNVSENGCDLMSVIDNNMVSIAGTYSISFFAAVHVHVLYVYY
jgi:hypothetical protein